MRRFLTGAAIAAALLVAGCDDGFVVNSAGEIVVYDTDGDVDAKDGTRACNDQGKAFLRFDKAPKGYASISEDISGSATFREAVCR